MGKSKISLLEKAVANFVITQPPPRLPLINDEISAWYAKHGIVFHYGSYDDGRAYGFNSEGAKAIGELADVLFIEQPLLRAGTRWQTLATVLAKAVHSSEPVRNNSPVTKTDLDRAEDSVNTWFREQTITRKFLVPCTIIPDHAGSFSVGSVRFVSLRDLAIREGISVESPTSHVQYGPLIQTMQARSASWLAEVEVSGLDEAVGTERANLAADVALVAVQLSLPVNYSREIARITGRTMPPSIGSVYSTNKHVHMGIHRREPGLGISGPVFEQLLTASRSLIDSIGRRVDGYLSGVAVLPKLSQAWCDGAFWLHEGLAEPVSTVAVAKLETAVEVLFSAESAKGSADRFRVAFESFYGLKPTDPIALNNPQTVKAFIKSIVGARSRVLHGTASTLSPDPSRGEQEGRPVFEMLAIDLIARFTRSLDQYAQDPAAVDDTGSFLTWINNERLKNQSQNP